MTMELAINTYNFCQDRILMGAERKSQYIDQTAKLATAYHEVWFT